MLSFFPQDVLDEIWDVVESVSEGFLPTFVKEELLIAPADTSSRMHMS